jgi:hypothetical protein
MNRSAVILLSVIALFATGCSENVLDNATTTGNTTVTLHFNLLDYLDPEQVSIQYGQDPVIPGDAGTFEIQTPTQNIDLSSDLDGVSSVDSVAMDISIAFHNETGNADLRYIAYLAALDEDPLQTPPIIDETTTLNGSQESTSDIEVISDARLLDLFNSGVMQYLARIAFTIADGSDNISGEAEVVRFDVTVVATL